MVVTKSARRFLNEDGRRARCERAQFPTVCPLSLHLRNLVCECGYLVGPRFTPENMLINCVGVVLERRRSLLCHWGTELTIARSFVAQWARAITGTIRFYWKKPVQWIAYPPQVTGVETACNHITELNHTSLRLITQNPLCVLFLDTAGAWFVLNSDIVKYVLIFLKKFAPFDRDQNCRYYSCWRPQNGLSLEPISTLLSDIISKVLSLSVSI